MKLDWHANRQKDGADTLVLLLHGMNCSPLTLSALADEIQRALPTAELHIPSLRLAWNYRFDLREVSREIAGYLGAIIAQRRFTSLVLAGHSAGGVLVQSVYLDLREQADLSAIPRLRMVLIAPITRGWSISHHLPVKEKMFWSIGLMCVPFLDAWESVVSAIRQRAPRPLWIMQLQRGAPFIVGLRLRWLRSSLPRPVIYILVGSVDELVSWRDMVDEVIDGANVQYREVPYSNHAEILDIGDKQRGAKRLEIILRALTEEAGQPSVEGNFVPWDSSPLPPEPEVERVVFVIHGIRDEGHWTQKIGARARRHFQPDKPGGTIAVETSSYGYFSMAEFLRPSARQQKIHWLMDEYVEATRRFPKAKFSYISHSNGTYLLAQALLDYPEVKYDRIAFAGSVVTTEYVWQPLLTDGRVGRVLNFTANQDWVVSLFPRMAQIFPPLRFLVGANLGGAGVLPFSHLPDVPESPRVIGGHGAAIDEWNWDNLACFALARPEPDPAPGDAAHYTAKPEWWCGPKAGRFVSPVIILSIIGLLIVLGWMAWTNPLLFWGGPALFLGLSVSLISWYASRADARPFSSRATIQKRVGWMFLGVGAVVLLWFVAPWLSYACRSLTAPEWLPRDNGRWFAYWTLSPDSLDLPAQVLGATRMLSVGLFVIGVRRVLTKM